VSCVYRRLAQVALSSLAVSLAEGAPVFAAQNPPPGCVASLKDVSVGVGIKRFESHYVTEGGYGYGEFSAGGFGGQSLWQRRGDLWCRIPTGATVLDRKAIAGFGVPQVVADRLILQMKRGPELAPPKPQPVYVPLLGIRHR
jgi:hypothetical protein